MTNQEAQVLAARLTRIWEAVTLSDRPLWRLADEFFRFDCVVDNLWVHYEQYLNEDRKEIEIEPKTGNLYAPESESPCGFLCYQFGEGIASIELDCAPTFNEHYLPLLRHNCWLSGFNIEATAHEKAEWLQGLTREELEAWNLRF